MISSFCFINVFSFIRHRRVLRAQISVRLIERQKIKISREDSVRANSIVQQHVHHFHFQFYLQVPFCPIAILFVFCKQYVGSVLIPGTTKGPCQDHNQRRQSIRRHQPHKSGVGGCDLVAFSRQRLYGNRSRRNTAENGAPPAKFRL